MEGVEQTVDMAPTSPPILTTEATTNDPRDRTVAEWMALVDETEKDKVAADITGRIEVGVEGSQSFGIFLLELAPHISDDVSLIDSAKGIELLDRVLEGCQPEILSRHDVSAVVSLLCARIRFAEDNNYKANIKGTANSLKYLSRMRNFLQSDVIIILQDFFNLNTSLWAQQTVDTRLSVYALLQELVDTFHSRLISINDIGRKLVDGFTALAVPEKDPSCLKVVFPNFKRLSSEQVRWGIADADLEKIWDSFSRYFPIKIGTFGVKNRDSAKPDPIVMRELLLQCFMSSSVYAQWAFPRLFEMLDQESDISADVKNEVFRTLTGCISSYDIPTLQEWSAKIWDTLKFEVLNGENQDFIAGALTVIKELANRLTEATSVDDWDNDTPLAPFLVNVVGDLRSRLHEPSQRYTLQCGKILAAVASSNPFAFHCIIKLVMGMLLVIQQTLDTTEKKCDMMRVFNILLQASSSALEGVEQQSQARNQAISILLGFRSSLADLYFEAMLQTASLDPADIGYRVLTIEGFALLFRVPDYLTQRQGVLVEGLPVLEVVPFLSEYEKGTIVESLCNVVLSSPYNALVNETAIKALQQTAVQDQKSFVRSTLQTFIEEIPDSVASQAEILAAIPKLDALASIACSEVAFVPASIGDHDLERGMKKSGLFINFCNALMDKLNSAIRRKGQLQYATAIVATLYHGMLMFDAALDREYPHPGPHRYDGNEFICQTGPYGETIMALYRLCAIRKEGPDNVPYMGLRELPCGEVFDDRFLFLVASCATHAIRSNHTPSTGSPLDWRSIRSGEDTNGYLHEVWMLFDPDFPSTINNFQQGKCDEGPAEKCSTTILSLGLFAGMRRDEARKLKVPDVAANMIANATSITNGASLEAHMSFLYILQILVNKFGATKVKMENGLTLMDVMRQAVIDAPMQTEAKALKVYQTLAYMTSAALLAFDPTSTDLVRMMLESLSLPSRSKKVAQSFRILLSPSEIINEKNFSIIRPLAKGRLYSLAVPVLIENYSRVPNPDQKQSHLIALAAVLSYLPLSIIQPDAARLLPLIIAGTDVENAGDDDQTKIECIDTLIKLIPEVPSVIEEHIDSIINRMTDRTHNTMAEPSDASINCRGKALLCLAALATHISPTVILKRKPRVIRELDIAVNDVSRNVRSAAERTKLIWFNVTDVTDA